MEGMITQEEAIANRVVRCLERAWTGVLGFAGPAKTYEITTLLCSWQQAA